MGDDQANASMKKKTTGTWDWCVTAGGCTVFACYSARPFAVLNKSVRFCRGSIKTDLGSSAPSSETSQSVPTR